MIPTMSDPVRYLPDVVLRLLWPMFQESDLLNCRTVSRLWRKHLDTNFIWKRFTPAQYSAGQGESPWKDYLYAKKRDTMWKKGIFQKYTMPLQPGDKVAAGCNYIYIGRGENVIFLDNTLREVQSVICPGSVTRLYVSEDILAVVSKTGTRYTITVYNGLKENYSVEATSSVSVIANGNLCYIKDDKMHVISEKGPLEEFTAPEDVVQIVPKGSSYAALQLHPVCRGSGYTFFRKLPDCDTWDRVLSRPNNNPFIFKYGTVLSNGEELAVVHAVVRDEYYSYELQILEGSEAMTILLNGILTMSTMPYFKALMTKKFFIYMKSESTLCIYSLKGAFFTHSADVGDGVVEILTHGEDLVIVHKDKFSYWKDAKKEYEIPLPIQCSLAFVIKDGVVVSNKDNLVTYTISRDR